MNWDAIGALGELLGALVVVISVIYLASQVRQNTATSRADALRTFSVEVSRQFGDWAKDERISAIWHKMLYEGLGRSEFSPEDALSGSFAVISRLSLYDAAFRSFKEGILSEQEFKPMLTTRVWDMPFMKDSWPIYRKELTPDFVEYIEKQFQQLEEA